MIWIFAAIGVVILGYGIKKTADGAKERAQKKEWWRLWVAGIALAAPVIYVLVNGIN